MEQKKTFAEYIPRELSESLLQGDIFRWIHANNSPWEKFGILITADCDLEHKKHRNLLSYCPILTFHDFLNLFWISDDISKSINQQTNSIATKLTKIRAQLRPEFTEPIKENLVHGWIDRSGIDGLLADIGGPSGKEYELIVAALQMLQVSRTALTSGDLKNQLSALATTKAAAQKKSFTEDDVNTNMKNMWSSYASRMKSLPGDLFFINEISPNDKEGYVVYLRGISEIKPDEIATTPIMMRASKVVRISQLRPTFRYRLTQKLAAVFSDIGLPNEYEQMCDETIALVASLLNILTK